MITATLTARQILRVSQDKSGTERSIDEQHAETASALTVHGITLTGTPYSDVGSASDYARKSRDGFGQLLADLRSGKFGADCLAMWENSRASRQPREWIAVADACRDRGILIFITTQRRNPMYDPRNGSDYADLVDEAVKAMRASALTSERVLRALNSNLNHADGAKPQGQTPLGFEREYAMTKVNGKTAMRPVGQKPDPETAPLIIELFQRLRRGHSFLSIERDWKARDIRSRRGNHLSAQNLRAVAARKAYIGIRVHKGEELPAAWPVIADYPGSPLTPDAFVTLFREVQVILADPARVTAKPGAGKHVFSMTLKCDECSGPEKVTTRHAEPQYVCRDRGCTRIDKAEVDRLLTQRIIRALSREDVYAKLNPADAEDAALESVRDALRAKRAELGELEAAPTPAGARAKLAMIGAMDELEAEIAELEAEESRCTAPNPLASVFPPGPDVAARWEAADVATKRQVARLLLVPERLGEVRVQRSPRPGEKVPASERLTLRRV
ncbi:recombinase family protein [Streptomyces albicerus]|uniref:recombinase family protein n=1 Tax=Streptomyces albicerus TaxID=2569859 RepID=UPI00124B56E3|nr:recombinase family protein [Streptomyces albicerus]